MLLRIICVAGLMLFGLVAAAHAECNVKTFEHQGAWQAFGGPCDDSHDKCGISTRGSNGKYLSVSYFAGDRTLQIQLGAHDWRVKNGAKVRLTMAIDDHQGWEATGTGFHFGNGDAGLWFDIKRAALDDFMGELRDGEQLIVRFPDSEVADWRASLDGSDVIVDAFLRCIRAI